MPSSQLAKNDYEDKKLQLAFCIFFSLSLFCGFFYINWPSTLFVCAPSTHQNTRDESKLKIKTRDEEGGGETKKSM
jgi:hypothetical protein